MKDIKYKIGVRKIIVGALYSYIDLTQVFSEMDYASIQDICQRIKHNII